MYPKILQLYGPFEINSFNAALLVGIFVYLVVAYRDTKRARIISSSDFLNISVESALAGILGARILHIISEQQLYHSLYDMVSIWNGGLSLLGGFFGAGLYSAWMLTRKGLPLLASYDRALLYAPLIHAIARVGCFLVGCCHGTPTAVSWAVTYVHPLAYAPHNIPLHPTQLYSSCMFLLLFCLLYALDRRSSLPSGFLSLFYVIGMSCERFMLDFLRGDRIVVKNQSFAFLSFHQWIALTIFISALMGCIIIQTQRKQLHEPL